MPNFFIDKFRIPPFLLPIYQAAGIQYDIRWQILAAINEIETDYGRNLTSPPRGRWAGCSSCPSSWRTYGVDANNDGRKDPYNPVDAIFAAARYLKAADGDKDIRKAIFAYNHAAWYVDCVMLRAKLIGGLPADLVGSLTGLTQGHFPVARPGALRRRRRREGLVRPATSAGQRDPGRGLQRQPPLDQHLRRARAPRSSLCSDGQIKQIGRVHAGSASTSSLQDAYGNHVHVRAPGRLAQPTIPRPSPRRQAKQAKAEEEIKRAAGPSTTDSRAGSQRQPSRSRRPGAPRPKGGRPRRAAAPSRPPTRGAPRTAPPARPIAVPSVRRRSACSRTRRARAR